MSLPPPGRSRTQRAAAQAKTVVTQWSEVIAESLGVRAPTPQAAAPDFALDAPAWHAAPLAACWLGHATTLLRAGGLTILTDPHLDDRAGMKIGTRKVGRRRAVAPPAGPDALPPIDLLLLSHAHMDHWDMDSLVTLSRGEWARRAHVVIPTGTRDLLPPGFGTVIELGWDKSVRVGEIEVRAVRPRHWGARFILDRHRGYNAYALDTQAGTRIVFGGDTAMTDAFDQLRSDRTPIELAVMGIGSYEPWEDQHATPEQVAEMSRRMGARRLMPIHHGTFHDSNVPLDEPLRRLAAVWPAEQMVCSRVGEVWVGLNTSGR
ncbi:MAG: MBL fold metallo-hydrolase [Phycisphaerales bacterium]